MRDIGKGCEGVAEAFDDWVDALQRGKVDELSLLLADDFRLTCDPAIADGRMNKAQFIEFYRHIRDCKIEILSLTARRYSDIAITQLTANVNERFENPVGATKEQLEAYVGGKTLAYASAWRLRGDRQWLCFQHHLIGPID